MAWCEEQYGPDGSGLVTRGTTLAAADVAALNDPRFLMGVVATTTAALLRKPSSVGQAALSATR